MASLTNRYLTDKLLTPRVKVNYHKGKYPVTPATALFKRDSERKLPLEFKKEKSLKN